MTTEQQRKMLEAAAKACGITGAWQEGFGICVIGDYLKDPGEQVKFWNPLTNPGDTAEMCAKLDIGVTYHSALGFLVCRKSIDVAAVAHYKDHDNSRLKAWMYAATMVAAKIGGYENAHP
jgi:hypothetical protein